MFENLPELRRNWRGAVLTGLLGLAAPIGAMAQQVLWADNAQVPNEAARFTEALRTYRPIQVNLAAMRAALLPAPTEQVGVRNSTVVVSLPLPEGGSQRFRVVQVPVMAPALAAKYPDIKTYAAQGIDDPAATARLDVSPSGFHAMVMSSGRTYFVDPALPYGDPVHHLVFNKSAMNMAATGWRCLNTDANSTATPSVSSPTLNKLSLQPNGTQLRTYRLALSNTPEYAVTKGNTDAGVQAGKVASMNRVNGVYERELAVRMIMVPNNNLLNFLQGTGTQPSPTYSNASGPSMLDENQQNVDRIIGSANYDIGHVFSTGGGGIAQKPSVCVNGTKARGVTGSPSPVGDAFDIDYVAHEMGHQFNCNHTFHAGNAGNCTAPGTRNAGTAYEPGSGVTIMGYAGICSPENVANNSIAYFHPASFDEALFHMNGAAASCPTTTTTGNRVPVPNAGANYFIPKSTPFALTGSATDADNDPLTYDWHEFDLNPTTTTLGNPSGNSPIFRAYEPSTSPTRYFPQLSDIVNNTTTRGEQLPTYARTMNFRLMVRDNHPGGGGVDYASMQAQVVATAGPFLVTQPNTSGVIWQAGAPARVTWDAANTTAAPINAANVDLLLSTDGGYTYPITLLAGTPNDGNETITVPLTVAATATARVMVRGSGNIFFDISNQNFQVEGNSGPTFFLNPAATTAATVACPGASATLPIAIGQISGFTGAVTLSTGTLPTGLSVTFANPTVQAGTSATATVSVAAGTAAGTYPIVLTGTSGGVTHSQQVLFEVQPAATTAAVALSPNFQNQLKTILRPQFSWTAVPNAVTYTLEISTSATFASGVTSIPNLTTTTYQLPTPLADNTTYYWRVKAESPCATGPYSAVTEFRTGQLVCTTTAATNVPQIILNTASGLAVSTISISNTDRVGEIHLNGLLVQHQAVDELEISLTNPQGQTVVLLPRGTCPGTSDINLNFDDLATAAISCPLGTATTANTVRPANPLAALAGGPAAGNWTLRVSDNVPGNGGRLDGWGLELCTLGEPPAAPGSISASYPGSAPGRTDVFWSAGGTNATYYELQRSCGASTNFVGIGGNIAPNVTYFDDGTSVTGSCTYRVRSCNTFGCSAWTVSAPVLGARELAKDAGVSVFPNPSTGEFNLTVSNEQHGAVALRVTDALGRTVRTAQLSKPGPTLTHALDLSALAPGVYQLHVALPNGTVVERLMKQ